MRNEYVAAAVALNNIGASLLERGCHQQAMKTLQDALAVFRFGFHKKGMDGRAQVALSEKEVADKLRQAMKRLSNLQEPSTNEASPHIIKIQLISSHDVSRAAPSVCEQGSSSTFHSALAITIEDVDEETNGPDAECATTLYNFALSYLCTSLTNTDSAKSTKLRAGAIKLLVAAHTIIENGRERATSHAQLDYLTHIEVFVLTFFLKIHPGSQNHYDRLAELKSAVTSRGHELVFGDFVQRAAAAA